MTGAVPAEAAIEEVIEPGVPIIDPHHHLWDRRLAVAAMGPSPHPFEETLALAPLYLLDDLLADLRGGHDIRSTVFIECRAFWRADGPEAMKPVGETEFVNGVAAMGASGLYGDIGVCAGIVGHADLRLGDAVTPVLEAHLAAGGGRFRGVRHSASWDADPAVLGPLNRVPEGLYRQADFREGFSRLAEFGLSFDSWILEPQLRDLIDLARAFPEQPIVLDHVGTPLGVNAYAGRRDERFDAWRAGIRALAESPAVMVKLGGLAMPFGGFDLRAGATPLSAHLAKQWRPYVETCTEAFGAERCMFESNFPVDRYSCDYRTLWNALKRTAAGCSADEKRDLFSGSAARFYRLEAP